MAYVEADLEKAKEHITAEAHWIIEKVKKY